MNTLSSITFAPSPSSITVIPFPERRNVSELAQFLYNEPCLGSLNVRTQPAVSLLHTGRILGLCPANERRR